MRQDTVLAEEIARSKVLLFVILAAIILANYLPISRAGLIDWDEGVFALQGQWLASFGAEGKPFNFQTPPLYQIIIGGLFSIFGNKTLVLYSIAFIASCICIYLVFKLSVILSSTQGAFIAVALFATTEFFLFFAKSGLSEALFISFFLASVLFFLKGIDTKKDKYFFSAGLFLTLAMYTKYSALPLFLSFFIIGLIEKKRINAKWFIYSIIVPLVLFVPYIVLMLKFIKFQEINARHLSFLGLNHLKCLIFLLLFSPSVLMLSIAYIIFNKKKMNKLSIYILVIVFIFFIMVGFYYPYFRLVYPIVPFLAIIGARFIENRKKYKIYIVLVFMFVSLIFGFQTIRYGSTVSKNTGTFVRELAKTEDVQFIYAVVPPNILFYIDQEVIIPEGHAWELAAKMVPGFNKQRKTMARDHNCLSPFGKTILIHATAFDDVKQKYMTIYEKGVLVESFRFIDAPVYYKDVFNPQRYELQFYEVYLIDNTVLKEELEDLWLFGFDRLVTVMIRE